MDSVIDIAEAVRRGERKAVEVLDDVLAAIDRHNATLNAFVHVDDRLARAAADAVDACVARGGDPGPLAGVPFGVKDLEDCEGMPTSHGSLLFAGRGPVARDDVTVARLRGAGAVPVGKTAAPEFGTLSFTKTKLFGTTRNPWNPERTPGGSSGGSAAAVAAGMVPFATASDGGGSTRIPAAFAGLVGHKASFGRVPNPSPMTTQTTSRGALATTVADAARLLDVLAGPDDDDRTSLPPAGIRYEHAVDTLEVQGLRARWSPDLGFARPEPEVVEIAARAARTLADAAGLVLDDDPVQFTDPVRAWLTAGAITLWLDIEPDMWPSGADDLTLYARRTLEHTESTTLPKYARALRRRFQLELECAALHREVDILLTPTTAVPAYAAEGPPPDGAMSTPYTMLANLCWNPAISVPAGVTADGLPVGLQIQAARHRDDLCLRLARIAEQVQPWPRLAPTVG